MPRRAFLSLASAGLLPDLATAAILRVGPERAVATLAQAAAQASANTVIEVDAGTYRGDVAVWTQPRIALRAVGGRVRLIADGRSADGKGIWVVRSDGMIVEGFDFEGARVPDGNGAGIRLDRGALTVRDCSFLRNEMGLLTGNDPATSLRIEHSEFAHNRRRGRFTHQLYAGSIHRLTVIGCYFHHGNGGHLLKTRAALNHIRYSRLTDDGGSASYELEFPDGGTALVVGNVIGQGDGTENRRLVAFGAEGYKHPSNELVLTHNTLVDALPAGGEFLHVRPAQVRVRAFNNLLVGRFPPAFDVFDPRAGNRFVPLGQWRHLADAQHRPGPDLVAPAVPLDQALVDGSSLQPTHWYEHPRRTQPLASAARVAGAMPRRVPRPR